MQTKICFHFFLLQNIFFPFFICSKEKCKNLFFHAFLLQKIFFHFLFFLKNKKCKNLFFHVFLLQKIFFHFLFFFKIKKCKFFSQNCMTKLMRFHHFFAEFHQVCYIQLTEMHVANSMKLSKKMMKSHQLRHAVLGKINFCFFLFFKKIKNGKIFFAEGRHGKITFCFFFLIEKIPSNATKVVCIVLAGGHSETLGDYLLL